MLPKKRRLSAADVRNIIASGRSARASHLSAKYLPGPSPLRAAAVVSKKVAKTAVERNCMRRALYRALEGASGSGSYVFFVNKVPHESLTPVFRDDLIILTASKR